MNIDELRARYLGMPKYQYDPIINSENFSSDEIIAIEKYGHWFDAISKGKIPLDIETDKIKHFYEATKLTQSDFKGRTKYEELWLKYKEAECPF
tara:strand:+ start:3442 stop:3723 length:282 start_codon:yes stop_codon:yes gene_type:complete